VIKKLKQGGIDMTRKVLIMAIVVLTAGALLTSLALAGNGPQKGKPTAKVTNNGVCPLGNVPQGGQGKAQGYGPGDGTGNQGNGPKDGTGYGPGQKGDGTGPKGKVNKGTNTTTTKPGTKQNHQGKGRKGGGR
jgi:hypothetical protein